MISPTTYSPEWISSINNQKEYKGVNPALFEKMIYAFSLLEGLAQTGLNFIFKGGTSLILMPIGSNRFSIDIDIITSISKEELDEKLNEFIGSSVFSSYHEDVKRTNAGGIPKAHYVFDFKSIYTPIGTILLDVLFEENHYDSTINAEIKSKWVDVSEPYIEVKIPTINSILGDKLTAFAPNTTGVPYSIGKPTVADKRIEIIKQLYDVSNLIEHCSDINEVKTVFNRIANRQIDYRKLNIEVNDVIEDIFTTALVLARRENNKEEPAKSNFIELQDGIKRFSEYLFTGSFRIDDAIVASAKAAFFTHKFLQSSTSSNELYSDNAEIASWTIENLNYNFPNRFKKTNKPAFYYWYKCLEIKNLIK